MKNGLKNELSIKAYRQALLGKKYRPYKSLKIVKCKSGEWFVQYSFFSQQKKQFVQVKARQGINYIKDPIEKQVAAEDLLADLKKQLANGYNPLIENELKKLKALAGDKETGIAKIKATIKPWSITEAIIRFRTFIGHQNYADRTVQTYKMYVDDLAAWIIKNGLTDIEASKFTEYDIMKFLQSNKKWSARTYNNYLKFFGGFFARCNRLEKAVNRGIRYEFDMDNADLKINKDQQNKPYTPGIAKQIKEQLSEKGNENLRDYIEWIYLSLMRPQEIRNLKVVDIDEVSRHIRIIGKTGDRLIPISDQLLALIKKRDVLGKPGDTYVFGAGGKVSLNHMHKDYFLVKYNELLKTLKLPTSYGPYGWKATAIGDMINAGFSDKEIMVLSGHKTQKAFEEYKKHLVIDNSHLMKGSTLNF